jgi:lipoyl(octanoyl) transferase
MEKRVDEIVSRQARELVWLLEHPALYTAGTSARVDDLLLPKRFPVFVTGRGGQYTYHGPGQQIAYVMLDLRNRGRDVRAFVRQLESWVIDTLAAFGISGERRDGRVGIWVADDSGDAKIAAIGVRVRHWVTFHGVSINISPNLAHYNGIVPCGIDNAGVTSLTALGIDADASNVRKTMQLTFNRRFG